MKPPRLLLLLALLPAGACAAPGGGSRPAPSTSDEVAMIDASAPRSDEPADHADAPDVAPAAETGKAPTDAEVLSLWKDPAFQKRFQESYLAVTDVEPPVTEGDRDALQEALKLIDDEKPEKAVALLQKNRGEGKSALFDFILANVRFQEEKTDEAAKAYEVAVDKYPRFLRAWRNLGLIRARQGDFDGASQAFTRVIELGGNDAVTYGMLGYASLNQKRWVAAESAYRMATLLDPKTFDWKIGLARSFFEQHRFADAVALCSSLIDDDPSRPDLWLLQANAYVGLEKPVQAAENLEMVDRLGASTTDSLNMLGDIYTNEELFDLAVGAYSRAMEKSPAASPERALRAAKILTARGALADVHRLIDQIEELHPSDLDQAAQKDLLKLRARLALAEGAGAEEVRVLQEIVRLDPLDGEALILLGDQAERDKDVEGAINDYERAEAIDSFEAEAKLHHAQLLVHQSRYAEALPLLRRAQALNPRDYVQDYLDQVERAAQQSR